MARGFGSTEGAGTSDIITTAIGRNFSQRYTIFTWIYYSGTGGGTGGRVFDSDPRFYNSLIQDNASDSYNFEHWRLTTHGSWRLTTAPSAYTGIWIPLAITYDASDTANDPRIWLAGSLESLTETSSPAGGARDITNLTIGNRNDNIRVWNGRIGPFARWEDILPDSAIDDLNHGYSPEFFPERRLFYLPMDGSGQDRNNPPPTISGTTIKEFIPLIEPRRRTYHTISVPGGTDIITLPSLVDPASWGSHALIGTDAIMLPSISSGLGFGTHTLQQATPGLSAQYLVDWDDDGDFGEPYEDITLYVASSNWHIGMSRPRQLVGDETRLELTLVNTDKRFSPENSSSPYFGQMEKRRLVRVNHILDGVATVMYTGWIDSIQVEGASGRTATLSASGAKQYLQEQKIELPLLENLRSDEIIERILTALHRPPALAAGIWVLGVPGSSELGIATTLADLSLSVALDQADTVWPFVADTWDEDFRGNQYVGESWEGGFKGYDAIEDVVRGERGRFFFDREGRAVFWSRDHLQVDSALDATFDNMHTDNLEYVWAEEIYNHIRVMVYPRSASSSDTTLWHLDEPIELRPGQSRTVQANYTAEGSDVQIAGRDVFVSSYVDDGDVSMSIEYQARGAKITLTNNDSVDRTVSEIILTGRALTTYNEIEVEAVDTVSLPKGKMEYVIDSKLMHDVNLAQSIADYELSRLKAARGEIISMELIVNDSARRTQAVTRTIGDRIRVIDDQLAHDQEYFIIGETHNWDVRGGYRVSWHLELAESSAGWLLGTAGYSELGETTTLGL